ncbi:bifunctional serine/threonine protein kinase/MFS transporter [Streptomyces sp. NPDC006662]|uniref:bifunctional serine/threonine protein kinase/MFS transporter n=1 Tax=Streptomyces sp. NPDC006662 TaxID=3156902 RepID=UPI0033BFD552
MEQLTGQDPTYIGPYRLIARLGEGGMGLVYLGRSDLGRTVAVKTVQAEHAHHPEFRRRFAREVAAARRVGGDWTAAVLDADTEAAVPWVATQYIPGPDLTTVVGRDFGPLPEHSVHTLANRLALALQAVHDAGLIHRDLKPSNVLVTVDGPRVIDFGIARALESIGGDSLLTRTGMLIGSPGFMSPEQVRGHELTPASDMFCLGAVLVYAATGRLLFGATETGLNAHLFRIAEEEADLTGIPDSLVGLVRACLAKDPTARPTPAQVAERTRTDRGEEWLPGPVLAQIGRKAAELLDFTPEIRGPRPDPRVQDAPAADRPTSYLLTPPAYSPTAYAPPEPARFGSPPGYGPSAPPPPGGRTSAPPGYGPDPRLRRGWALAMATLGQLAVMLGASTSTVLLYNALHALGSDPSSGEWMVTAHFVAFGALLFVGGHLADLVGRKATLLIGLAGFTVATAVQASTPNAGVLLGAFIVQGAFAALATPASFGLVAGHFTEPRARTRAFAVYSPVVLGGSLLSLFLGVPLAEFVTWRVYLYVVCLLALLALVGTAALVRDLPDRKPDGFDALGVLLGTVGVGAIIVAFHASFVLAWACLIGGVLLIVAFFLRRTRTPGAAILPVYDAGARGRRGALLALFLTGLALESVAPRLAIFLWSAGEAMGLVASAVVAGSFLLGSLLLATRLLPRIGFHAVLVWGLLLSAAGSLLMLVDTEAPAAALPSLFCLGVGLGMAGTALYSALTEGIAPHDSAGRGALTVATQEVSGHAAAAALASAGLNGESGGDNPVTLYLSAAALLAAALIGGLMLKAPARTGPPAAAALRDY